MTFPYMLRPRNFVAVTLLAMSVLAGCGKSTVAVNVHGVNYSGNEFSYLVIDPVNPDSSDAGEHIDPFGAGGTTCCFPLPKKWRPGIKVEIRTIHWLPKRPDGTLPEVNEVHVVDVPHYEDDKPGELWVLRAADGTVSVISSDFQPDHPRWPGKLKGWPIPTLEYRRARWELYRKYEEDGVKLFQSELADLESEPERSAREAWEYAKERHPEQIRGFTGPDDPRYRDALKKQYEEGLIRSKRLLQQVMEARP